MLCIPIFCATVFYVVALVGACGVGVHGALVVQRLAAGDLVFVYFAGLAALSYLVTKEYLSKCLEAIRMVRRQLNLRRA